MFIVLKVLGDLARQIGPWVMSVGMAIGPVSPYIPQYLETRRSGVAGGFSPLVAFLLVISSIGRIFYWYEHVRSLLRMHDSVRMPSACFCAHLWRYAPGSCCGLTRRCFGKPSS